MKISIEGLNKVYPNGNHALKDVNLQINNGMFGLLGPNGAGKSSLMRILVTLMEPSSGIIKVNGYDLSRDREAIRSMLGYLPQDFRFFSHLKTYEFLDYAARLAGMKDSKPRKQAVDKLQGRRATPRLTAVEKATLAAAGDTTTEISSSQMGFINRIDFLDKLIQLLFVMPEYSPNEEDLKPVNLINYYNLLKSSNSQALATENQLDIARTSRNETLYKPEVGMIDTAKAAKMYVKSLFGARSAQYKQISGLAFRDIKVGIS